MLVKAPRDGSKIKKPSNQQYTPLVEIRCTVTQWMMMYPVKGKSVGMKQVCVQFFPFGYFPRFSDWFIDLLTVKVPFIIDKCRWRSAVVAPVRYECDSTNQIGTEINSQNLDRRFLDYTFPCIWCVKYLAGYEKYGKYPFAHSSTVHRYI